MSVFLWICGTMANTGLLRKSSEGCKWPHQQMKLLYIRFFFMGYIIWPNEELGGEGSRVATYCLSKPAYPHKKRMCRYNRIIIVFCFSASNDITVLPTLDKITKILTIFFRVREGGKKAPPSLRRRFICQINMKMGRVFGRNLKKLSTLC